MFNLYTLDNGLRVVTEYIEHVNSISVGIMVQNGSRNESKDVNGISHFIEHMFFKGTDKRSAKEIVQELWGNEAGGHPGIAGSPRGQEMTEKDMRQLVKAVNERYNKINEMNEPIYFEPDEVSLDD